MSEESFELIVSSIDELKVKLREFGKKEEEIDQIVMALQDGERASCRVDLTEDQRLEFKKPV